MENAGGESRLAVVNVADGADVHVRLRTIKFCHSKSVNLINNLKSRINIRFTP